MIWTSIFLPACWPSLCLLWKNVCSGLLFIFHPSCSFSDVELYELLRIFWILSQWHVPVISFANILSQPIDCLFVYWWVFLLCKLLGLIRSNLFIFATISFNLGARLKKKLSLHFMSVFSSAYVFLSEFHSRKIYV